MTDPDAIIALLKLRAEVRAKVEEADEPTLRRMLAATGKPDVGTCSHLQALSDLYNTPPCPHRERGIACPKCQRHDPADIDRDGES